MQEINKEILIKSLQFNMFYPRDLNDFIGKIINFSYNLNDLNDAYITSNFDELGYARRYCKKLLYYKLDENNEDLIIKASVYGADGILTKTKCQKNIIELAKNCGFSLAFIAKNNFDLLKGISKGFDVFISDQKLLNSVPKNKYKGVINGLS